MSDNSVTLAESSIVGGPGGEVKFIKACRSWDVSFDCLASVLAWTPPLIPKHSPDSLDLPRAYNPNQRSMVTHHGETKTRLGILCFLTQSFNPISLQDPPLLARLGLDVSLLRAVHCQLLELRNDLSQPLRCYFNQRRAIGYRVVVLHCLRAHNISDLVDHSLE